MDIKYILEIIIVVFLIFSLMIFIRFIGLNLHVEEQPKELLKVITIEGFDDSIIMDKNNAFCESHRGSSGALNDACGKLSKNNCLSTSCCVWTSDQKCLAGDANGPTFNSDSNGKTKDLGYYFFQDKCYGEKC